MLNEILLVFLSALLSWWITERYFNRSLRNQDTEQSKQIEILKTALQKLDTNNNELITQNYIDSAVKAWKEQGTAVHYLNSLSIPNNQKSDILFAAALRHKGRPPKNNPYI